MSESIDSSKIKVKSHAVEVKLLRTTFNDPHVIKIMDHITGGDPDKIKYLKREVQKRIDKLDCVAQVSPVLYEAAIDNVIETVLFDKYWDRGADSTKSEIETAIEAAMTGEDITHRIKKAPAVPAAPQFNIVTLNQIVTKIKTESKSFFPLRNMLDFHTVDNPRISVTGDGDARVDKQFGDVKTAAATADGTFIFNKQFCQALLDFAHLKGIKAKNNRYGKKYISQGGTIPDEWEYIEFLVRHEFMHYTYSDFQYEKIIPEASGKLINWVGDFRTNHRLVQQGFTQLPMGLFSSYVNFHKQSTYSEMYNLVKSEFDKLKDECKKELGDELDAGTDHHGELGKNSDGSEKIVDRKIEQNKIDEWNKKNNDKSEKEDGDEPPDYLNKPPAERQPGSAKGGNHGLDYASISPKYKWDALLKKMIGEASFTMDQSYQKISRRAIGTMHQVLRTGRGAVKPGDVKNPSKKKIKLAVIIDSSGSMSYVINTVMANLDKLLIARQGATNVNEEFYLFIFSGEYDIYKCTPGTSGMAANITDVATEKPGPLGKLKLHQVLSSHKSGGTVFSSNLADQIKKLASKGYNCLVVTDGDLLIGSNFTNFRELYNANRKHVWLLLDSKETFAQFCKEMKEISNNTSHM